VTDFSGRSLPNPGFADDDGTADATLAAALTAFAVALADRWSVYRALAGRRLLVPVVALLNEAEQVAAPGGGTLRRDKDSDMAVVTLTAPDGTRALPVFTTLGTLADWRADARPVPVSTQVACQAALAEPVDVVVIDPAGPVPFTIDTAAVRAFAAGRVPVLPHADDELLAALGGHVRAVSGVLAASLSDGAELTLALRVARPALADADALRQAVGALATALADDPVLRDRLAAPLRLAVLPEAPGAAPLPGVALPLQKPNSRVAPRSC
jgi:hypothetical protein